EGASTTINVLSNDTVEDGVSSVSATDGTSGTVTVNSDNTVTYTPTGGFSGTDTFTYTATDNAGDASSATVTAAIDTPPVAVADSATTKEDTSTTINVLGNDTVEDSVSSVSASSGSHGTTAVNTTNNTVTYTPTSGYNGTDTFTYTVTDSDGVTSS